MQIGKSQKGWWLKSGQALYGPFPEKKMVYSLADKMKKQFRQFRRSICQHRQLK